MKNAPRGRSVSWLRFVRMNAFRHGYEEYRTGKPFNPDYGVECVAYEEGRLRAAELVGYGRELIPLPARGKERHRAVMFVYFGRLEC